MSACAAGASVGGYIPDGQGLTYQGKVLPPMAATVNDDDLVLYFTKAVR